MPACAKPYAMAIDPSAVTIHDSREIAPTCAMLAGSMMMPEPIMFTATMNVSCIRFIFFCSCIALLLRSPRRGSRFHAVDVVAVIHFFGALDLFGESRKHVAVFLQGAQVCEPWSIRG